MMMFNNRLFIYANFFNQLEKSEILKIENTYGQKVNTLTAEPVI